MIKQWLAKKLILGNLDHRIRNATTCIAGILARVKCSKVLLTKDIKDIYKQLENIENALTYVRRLNKGNNG